MSNQDVFRHFSSRRVVDDVAAIYQHCRRCTSTGINRAATEIVRRLKAGGIADVELIKLPADGKTFFGGWVMSKAWDATSATLSVVVPAGKHDLLADYRANPHSLMMWSPPTPPGGIEGQVVLVNDAFNHRGSLRGKFVLVDRLLQIAVDIVAQLARRGAAAVLSDHIVEYPGIKEGAYLDDASQYHNYAVSPWDGPRRIPGFSLRRGDGRRLRQLLAHGPVRLRADVKSRLYDGVIPLVSARLPGKSSDEIILTAHMDEPGGSDNASGTAMAMELLRALAAHVRATGQPLEHTVRLLLSVELRGIQGYLNTRKPQRRVLAGLDLDQVGYDHRAGRTSLHIVGARPSAPSYLEILLGDLAKRASRRPPLFRWDLAQRVVVNDCHFAAPPFDAPMACLGQHANRTYHTNLDRPTCLSEPHLQRMGHLLLEATSFLARGDYDEIHKLAQRIRTLTQADMRKNPRHARVILSRARRQWEGLDRLLPAPGGPILPDQLAQVRKSGQLIKGYLYPRFSLQADIRRWDAQLARGAASRTQVVPRIHAPGRVLCDLRDLVPSKEFAGYLGWEDLSSAQRRALTEATGITPSWGAPDWLQYAIDLSTGKQSLEEIYLRLLSDGVKVDPAALVSAMKFLQRFGKVSCNVVLEKNDLLRAIRRVGIRAGDIVVAHTSLSAFGYIRGGADAVIDALLTVIGPKGTLAVPTHSLNWIGKPPYDPVRSPTRIGAVPIAFLRRPEAVRSLHPTHAVAAIGPAARRLVQGHDHTCPALGREGFWGHFVEAGGKVVLMCPLGANTLLHAVDLWAGAPMPSVMAHRMENGRRVEFVEPALPWHTTSFTSIYDALFRKHLIRAAPLGQGKIHSLRAQDAIAVGVPLVRRNPLLVAETGCTCWYCTYVRQQVAPQRRPGR